MHWAYDCSISNSSSSRGMMGGDSESLVEQHSTRRERRQGIGLNHHHPPAAALHEGIDARVSTQAKPLCHVFDARTHLLHHPR